MNTEAQKHRDLLAFFHRARLVSLRVRVTVCAAAGTTLSANKQCEHLSNTL